jgi:hypothetical protein
MPWREVPRLFQEAPVERAVSELQHRLQSAEPANWLERFTGSFKDEPAFAEVVASGRAFRTADRPLENRAPAGC